MFGIVIGNALQSLVFTAIGVLGLGVALGPAYAQKYPQRAIRFIIPFSAGGAVDIPARILGQKLSERLNQQVVIENRSGAGSTMGAELASRAAPDGYTLFMISNTHFVSAALYKKLTYDALNDFTPISQMTSAPNVLVVHPSLPVNSIKELIRLAKLQPNRIDFASSGNGSTQHLTGALFMKMADIRLTHVPYRGSAPATADLLAGQVTVGFPGIAGMLPFINSGKLRALGVTGAKRALQLPQVPTIAEAGVAGYEMVAWFGVSGPKLMARDLQLQIHGELLQALKSHDFQKNLQSAGHEIVFQETPEKFYDFLKMESIKWAQVVRDSGARVE